nr:hypothetical protein CTI12_AA531400 [Tanacetum cinerariifolium]
LDEFVNKLVVKNCKAKSSEEEPKVVRKNDDAIIIEEWVSNNKEEDPMEIGILSFLGAYFIALREDTQHLSMGNFDSTSKGSVNRGGAGNWHPNDIKFDILEYDGKLDPNEFMEWLRTVERVFNYKQTTEDNKVKIVALKLQKYASTWWSNTFLKRERARKEKIRTWPKMKAKMKQKFLPTYYIQNSFSQLHSLRQGNGTAEEYSCEFEYLLMKCDVPEDDPQTLIHYLGVLEPRVANVVELHSYQTLVELTILSHKGLGHITSECPNKRIVSLADFKVAGGFEFVHDFAAIPESPPGDDVEVTRLDDGPCLVVHRTLNTTPIQKTELQRESIFHTWCTIAQKFDHRVIHDGYVNTYTFSHNNRNIILSPITHATTSPTPSTTLSTLLQSKHHEHQSFKEFILLGLDEDDTLSQPILSPLVQALLKSYSQVFPAEITPGVSKWIKKRFKPFATGRYPDLFNKSEAFMTEVTNRTLGSLLRALISSNLKQWEDLLPRAEFTYNWALSKTTGISPFMAVYGLNPTTPLDLAALDTSTKFSKEASDVAADTKSIHQRIHDKIVKTNELIKYRRDKVRKHDLFKPGDLVWLHFRKERFPSKRHSKLSPRSDGPFKVLAKVNDNAYEIKLPGDSSVSATINVADRQPYYDPDEPLPILR